MLVLALLLIALVVWAVWWCEHRRCTWTAVGRESVGGAIVRRWRNGHGHEVEVRSSGGVCWYDTTTGRLNLELSNRSEDAERVLRWKGKGG